MKIYLIYILLLTSVVSYSQQTFEELLDKGSKYYQDGDFKSAISIFGEAIIKKPDNLNGYYFRGQMYLLNNELDNAIADFKNVIKLRDTLYQAFQYIGICYLNKRDTNQALFYFNKALNLYPNYFDALQNKATIYIGQLKYIEALSIIDKALQIKPYNSLANFQKGYCLLCSGNKTTALEYLEKSQNLGYNDDVLYNGLAICYLDKQDYSKALIIINKAITINNNISGYHVNKAIILMNMGLKEMSKESFKNAIKLGSILNEDQKKIYDSL